MSKKKEFVPFSPPTFDLGSTPGSKRHKLVIVVQSLSLIATGWMVWSASVAPRLRQQTPGQLMMQVLGYALLAWAWSAVVAFGLYAMVPLGDRSEMVPEVLRTAATAVWFAPAMILLSEFSPAALVAALVLVVYASRLLYAQWRRAEPIAVAPTVHAPMGTGEFRHCELPRGFVWSERLPAVAVALCLEAGAVAVVVHYPLLGAAWLCMGTSLLTVFSMATGAADAGRPPTLPRSALGIVATILMAALLTAGGGRGSRTSVAGEGQAQGGGGARPSLVEAARATLRHLFYGETPTLPGGTAPTAPPLPTQVDTGASGGFPGVILWPEVKPVTTLIAPPPPAGMSIFQGQPARPLGIPFGGEYWLFRWPYAKPPSTSILERGSPAKMAFSSTDHQPLQMEAHQKLDTPIDIRCCSSVELEIVNADRFPGTLDLELVLLNTAPVRPESLSLGRQLVRSMPDISKDPVWPARETLVFAVPGQPSLDEFNEFKIVFHRDKRRMDKSAKTSIERFVLRPR